MFHISVNTVVLKSLHMVYMASAAGLVRVGT